MGRQRGTNRKCTLSEKAIFTNTPSNLRPRDLSHSISKQNSPFYECVAIPRGHKALNLVPVYARGAGSISKRLISSTQLLTGTTAPKGCMSIQSVTSAPVANALWLSPCPRDSCLNPRGDILSECSAALLPDTFMHLPLHESVLPRSGCSLSVVRRSHKRV